MELSNEGIELRIYDGITDPTVYKDTIQEALAPQYLEGLSDIGSGKFNINVAEPKTTADPTLLAYRNVCKYSINGQIVGAFLLENNKKVRVADGERASEEKEITGEGLLKWLQDASVHPMLALTANSMEKRYFNFGSYRGDWYKAANWSYPSTKGKWGANPWRKRPTNWPADHKASWVWNGNSSPANSVNLFRLEFNTGDDGGRWSVWAAGDNFLEMWLDGEKIIDTDFEKSSIDDATKVDLNMPAGDHVLAARVTNGSDNATNPGAFMCTLYHSTADAAASNTARIWTGQNGDDAGQRWVGYYLGTSTPTPVWTPGQILLQLIKEGKANGVRSMSWIDPTFTGAVDSQGVAWQTIDDDWELSVGEDNILTVLQKIQDALGYYAWIDPVTYEFNITQSRGTDRSVDPNAIVFEEGKNLQSAELEGVGNKIKNSLLTKTGDGWLVDTSTRSTASIAKYGTLEGYYSADVSRSVARSLMPSLFKQYADAEEGATYNIVTDEYIPWKDFSNGDLVIAPDKDGLNKPRQVVSISFQEDEDTGAAQYTLEFDTVFQSQEARIAKAITKITGGGVGNSMASSTGLGATRNPALPPATATPDLQPQIPQNLAATSDGAWTPNGVTPVSTVHLTWDPVVLDTSSNEIVVAYYEVWGTKSSEPGGMRSLTMVTSNTADITPIVPGESWIFEVRALMDVSGPYSDFSSTITIAGIGPNAPLPAPSAPVLTSAMGLIKAHWDGLLVNGAPAPQFRYVYAQIATAAAGPWTIAGSAIQRGGGDITLPGLSVGTTYWVRFLAVDGIAIVSAASATASIVVAGVDLSGLDAQLADLSDDLDQLQVDLSDTQDDVDDVWTQLGAVQTTAGLALTAANGLNHIYWQATAPTGGTYINGDTWFDSDDGNKIYNRVGASWVPQVLGSSAIADLAITNAKIANLDAAKITTGLLDAARIASQSITADKVLIGDFENAAVGSDFENAAAIPWVGMATAATFTRDNTVSHSGTYSGKLAAATGNRSFVLNRTLTVQAGETWRANLWVAASADYNGTLNNSKLRIGNAVGGGLLSSFSFEASKLDIKDGVTFNQITADFHVPDDGSVTSLQPSIVFDHTVGSVWVDDIDFRRLHNGQLIVDGTITALQVQVESLTGDLLQFGTVTGDKVGANEITGNNVATRTLTAENIMFDSLTGNEILAGSIGVDQLTPSIGDEIDISANGAVNVIVGRIQDIEDSDYAQNSDLDQMQTYYSFTDDGAIVSTPGSPFAVAVRSDSIDMLENGNVVSYWNSGTLYVDQMVGAQVTLGNHQIEQYNDGTVVRALN